MNKKILTAAVILSTMGGCLVDAAAETPVYTLDAVVVTANRTETKELDTNADVSVVTAKDIEQHHYKDVSEAIKNVPGVSMQNQGGNGQTYFSNKVYINGSDKVVFLVDGVRQNVNGITIGSAAQVGNYTNMDSVERIEVMKGSASTLYGSDAQGGVINIITKRPEDGTMKTKVGASLGSYDGENYSFSNEGAQNGFFWQIGAHKQLQGDFKDGWERNVVNHLNAKVYNVKVGKDLGNDSSVTFTYQKYKSDYTIPGSGSNDPLRRPGNKDVDNLAVQYRAKVNERLNTQISVYRNNLDLNDTANGDFNFKTQTTGISNQWDYKMDNQLITGGIDYYKDKIKHYLGSGNDTSASGKSISNMALYLQDIWQISDEWSLTPGVRLDHNDQFGNHTSPSLVLGYKPTENTNYYLSYKEFFVAPNLYQLYGNSSFAGMESGGIYYPGRISKGNLSLDPEEGQTFELGVHHQFDSALYGVFSIYKQHAKNLINYSKMGTTSTGDEIWQYQNTGKLDSWGVNAQLNKTFSEHLNGYVGYAYTHVDAKNDAENDNLNGILPKHTINVGLNYSNAKLNAYIDGQGIMDRNGAKNKKLDKYGSFWVWNIGANYQIHSNANIFAKVNNIFDQFYTTTTSYVSGPDTFWYSAPGRNYELGVSFQF